MADCTASMGDETMLTETEFEILLNTESENNNQQQQQSRITLFHMQIWLFDAGWPLFFSISLSACLSLCLSLSLSGSHLAIVCPLEFTLNSLSHTHTYSLPWGCVWLRHEINFWGCILPPLFGRPLSLTTKWDWCCASLRMSTLPPSTLYSHPRIL